MFVVAAALAGCTRRNLSPNVSDAGGSDASMSHDGGTPCSALTDQASCSARPDCVVFTCFACSCTPAFAGCGAMGDPGPECPGLGCASPECCHSDSDCQTGGSFEQCQVPPIDPGCGICFMGPSSCMSDADCGMGEICDPAPCSCQSGSGTAMTCQAGCSTGTPCSEVETCGADNRCHARPCDASCTGNYTCAASGDFCARKPCTTDGDCAAPGYCINGTCSIYVGQCVAPAA